jgi:putative transposase
VGSDDIDRRMIARPVSYKRHLFPSEIIAHAVWLYFRFPLSLRLVEEMLIERGIVVSYETIRRWAIKFGPDYARRLKRKAPRPGDIWHLDEAVISINGEKRYLWREIDQEGYVLDEIVQIHRDTMAARRLLTRLLEKPGRPPKRIPTYSVPTPPPSARSCRTSNIALKRGSTIGRRIPTYPSENENG